MSKEGEGHEVEGGVLDGESLSNLFSIPSEQQLSSDDWPVFISRVSEGLETLPISRSLQSEPLSCSSSSADDIGTNIVSGEADNQSEPEMKQISWPLPRSEEARDDGATSEASLEIVELDKSEESMSNLQKDELQNSCNPAGSCDSLMGSQVLKVGGLPVAAPSCESSSQLPRLIMEIKIPSTFDWIIRRPQFPFGIQQLMAMIETTTSPSVEDIATDAEWIQNDGWESDGNEEVEEDQDNSGPTICDDGWESDVNEEDEEEDTADPTICDDGWESDGNEEVEEEEDTADPTICDDGWESDGNEEDELEEDPDDQTTSADGLKSDKDENAKESKDVGEELNGAVLNKPESHSADVQAVEVATSPSAPQPDIDNSRALVPQSASSVKDEDDKSLAQAVANAPRFAFLARKFTPAPKQGPSSACRLSASTVSNETAQPGPSTACRPSTSKVSNGSSKPDPCRSSQNDPKPSSSKACNYEEESEDSDSENESSDDEDWTDEQREMYKPPLEGTYHWTNKSWRHRTEQGHPRRESHAPNYKYERICLKCGAIGFHKTKRCQAGFEEKEWYLWSLDLDKTYPEHLKKREQKRKQSLRYRGRSEEEDNERVPGREIRRLLGFADQQLHQTVRQLREAGHYDQANILGSNGSLRIWILGEHPSIPRRKWYSLFNLLMSYIDGYRCRFLGLY